MAPRFDLFGVAALKSAGVLREPLRAAVETGAGLMRTVSGGRKIFDPDVVPSTPAGVDSVVSL